MIALQVTDAIIDALQALPKDRHESWFQAFLKKQPAADHEDLTDFFKIARETLYGN